MFCVMNLVAILIRTDQSVGCFYNAASQNVVLVRFRMAVGFIIDLQSLTESMLCFEASDTVMAREVLKAFPNY